MGQGESPNLPCCMPVMVAIITQTTMRPLFVSLLSVILKLTSYCFVSPIQYNNKEAIAQDFILYDAITKRAAVLGQLATGLSTLGLLDLMKQFPQCFVTCFTDSNAELTRQKFLSLLEFPANECVAVAQMLHQFVWTCTQDGMLFLYFL